MDIESLTTILLPRFTWRAIFDIDIIALKNDEYGALIFHGDLQSKGLFRNRKLFFYCDTIFWAEFTSMVTVIVSGWLNKKSDPKKIINNKAVYENLNRFSNKKEKNNDDLDIKCPI